MDNLGRTVVATACVLVSAFVAGTPRTFGARPAKASTMTQTSSASSVSKTECIDGACTALAVVESGFSPTAKSKAGAVGLWQLMPETAKEYGLIVDKDYDERRSITKSSDAAADHLASLYGKLGSWELVLAAYDMGARALEKK